MALLRLNVAKKQEASIFGEGIEKESNGEINVVQVVGHTVLLYKASNPPKSVSKLLEDELRKSNQEDK